MTVLLRVAESGWSTSIQDFGRPGHQRKGIPVSGALDTESLALANHLVGNPAATAAIEVAYVGPTLVAETGAVRMAIVGAQARLERRAYAAAATGTTLQPNESFVLERGEALKIGALKGGAVLYVAIEGGLDVPLVLGSAATDVRGGFGGWNGRALQAGDRLPLKLAHPHRRAERRIALPPSSPPRPIRVLLGPQADYFAADEIGRFLATTFTVSSESNRMGMRLNGGLIRHAKGFNITSDAITFGSIQIMGNGQPLVMMADRPTTGGYPKIATIISADLPRIGRLQAGATFGFSAVSVADAEVARKTMIGEIQARVAQIRDISANSSPNFFEYNLISGVFDALS
jgi:biotin-dependent carboxylase-like uncharacterized protein